MLLHFIRDKIHHSRQTREPCKSHWRNSYTILNVVTKTHIHSSRTKKHKANKSWESWFRRQRGTSRTLILRDCSLLCTSKWRISVSVLRMAASCLELNRHFFFFHWTMVPFLLQRHGYQRGWTRGSWLWLFWSEVQSSVWVKIYPRVHFGDGQLWPWKKGSDKIHIQTNLTGHNPVSEWERHSGECVNTA